jgi:uncharacterized protein with GYD domain
MRFKYFSALLSAVLLVNMSGFALADTSRKDAAKKRASANRLVSLLPASDGVAVIDSKRFFNDSLQKVLAANKPMLGEMMARLDEMQSRTGIDLRKFDQVVVGVAMRQVSPTEVDYDTVVIASGDINTAAMSNVAQLASKGNYREEKIGSRTVYVFSAKDAAAQASRPTNSKLAAAMDKMIAGISKKEVAITSIDPNTLVMGSIARVRQTLDTKNGRLEADVRGLLPNRETSVIGFAARTNGMLTRLLPVEADALGANLDSIQYLTGSLDFSAAGASVQIMARTKKPDQAVGLKDTLEGLKMVGSAIFGNSKRTDQQVYGRLLKNAQFTTRGSDVTIDVSIAQADIDTLIAEVK